MPTMRYRTPAILARRLGVKVIVPESAERATGIPVRTVSCTAAILAPPLRAAAFSWGSPKLADYPVARFSDRTAKACKWQASNRGKEEDAPGTGDGDATVAQLA